MKTDDLFPPAARLYAENLDLMDEMEKKYHGALNKFFRRLRAEVQRVLDPESLRVEEKGATKGWVSWWARAEGEKGRPVGTAHFNRRRRATVLKGTVVFAAAGERLSPEQRREVREMSSDPVFEGRFSVASENDWKVGDLRLTVSSPASMESAASQIAHLLLGIRRVVQRDALDSAEG